MNPKPKFPLHTILVSPTAFTFLSCHFKSFLSEVGDVLKQCSVDLRATPSKQCSAYWNR